VILHRLQPGDGGVIAVDRQGNIAMQYNTEAMARGAANSSGRFDVYWELAPERKQQRPSVPAPAADGSSAGVDSDSQ
jgi:hypothetical protein